MKKLKPFNKFFIVLTISFIVLTLVFSNKSLRKYHCIYYSYVAAPILNVLNPHVYAEFEEGAPSNENDWGITFRIWDKRKYDERIRLKSFRAKNPPDAILYQNPHELFLIPSLFLICLFLATPINWKSKIWKIPLGLFIFYIFMTGYLSYRFEFTLNSQGLPLDSIWHGIISFLGLGGTTDPIFIVALFIWLMMERKVLFNDLINLKAIKKP